MPRWFSLFFPAYLLVYSLWRAKLEGLTLATMPMWLWIVLAGEIAGSFLLVRFLFPRQTDLISTKSRLRIALGLCCLFGMYSFASHDPWYALRKGGIHDWASTLDFLRTAGLAFLLSVSLYAVGLLILLGIVNLVRKFRPQQG